MAGIKLIVGLGNPGKKYERTRHNAGFRVVDLLAEQAQLSWRKWSEAAETAARPDGVLLAKPQSYMNNSGFAVQEIARFHKFEPGEILVVVDDFSIPLGALRLRTGGSAGGHNGLASIISHLATTAFPRLRLGIGPLPEHSNSPDFVLSPFPPEEERKVKSMAEEAAGIIDVLVSQGWDKAASKLAAKLSGPLNGEKGVL
jgi:PTH1 family peptidyl-tRNA hydrolase